MSAIPLACVQSLERPVVDCVQVEKVAVVPLDGNPHHRRCERHGLWTGLLFLDVWWQNESLAKLIGSAGQTSGLVLIAENHAPAYCVEDST